MRLTRSSPELSRRGKRKATDGFDSRSANIRPLSEVEGGSGKGNDRKWLRLTLSQHTYLVRVLKWRVFN